MPLLRSIALLAAITALTGATQPAKPDPVATAKAPKPAQPVKTPAPAKPDTAKPSPAAKPTAATPAPAKYAAGQVWEYRARPKDAGSLLKIQKIEPYGRSQVYHISVIGLTFSTPGVQRELPHIPVSLRTLNASVTKESPVVAGFPSNADEGIAEWQREKGGVFAIPVSRIVGVIDTAVAKSKQPQPVKPAETVNKPALAKPAEPAKKPAPSK